MKVPPEEKMRSEPGGADTGASRKGCDAGPKGVDRGRRRRPNEAHGCDDNGRTGSTGQ